MSKLKLYLLIMLAWFFGLYNLERLISPINLASFVYLLSAGYAVLIILFRPINRLDLKWLALAGLLPFIILKYLLGYEIGGTNLPLTITESTSLFITIFLSWQVGRRIESLRSEILSLTVGSAGAATRPFEDVQAECYREIRRARHYNRPAAVLSIAATNESMDLSVNHFIQEAQTNIIRQYITARTADLLRTALKETDVVMMRNSHFLILLPETTGDHLPTIIERLQTAAQGRLGLALNVGVSTFPDDAITFESLVESAERRMHEDTNKVTEDITKIQAGKSAQKELNPVDSVGKR